MKQKKKGGFLSVPTVVFAVFVILPLLARGPVALLPVIVIGIIIFVVTRSGKKADPERKADKPCANPEPHRHYETAKPCPNPEPHQHRAAPARPQPMTRSEQDEAARRKRLENMRVLYDAGLLTKEEYNYEVRRVMRS